MKKLFIILFVIGGFVSTSYSQTEVGLRAGLNVSNIVGSKLSDQDFLLGPHAGLFFRFNADERVFFQPEVLFSMKGSAYRTNVGGAKYVSTSRLNYLDIPLMVGLEPINNFDILLGLQPSFLLGSKYSTKYLGNKNSVSGTDGLHKMDVGLVAGLQFESDSGFDFGFRVGYGLITLSNQSNAYKTHNVNFMATVGYALGK